MAVRGKAHGQEICSRTNAGVAFQVGDRIEVAERVGQDSKIQRYRGKITAITPAMLVVDTGKYRVTVLKGAWWSGAAVVKRL